MIRAFALPCLGSLFSCFQYFNIFNLKHLSREPKLGKETTFSVCLVSGTFVCFHQREQCETSQPECYLASRVNPSKGGHEIYQYKTQRADVATLVIWFSLVRQKADLPEAVSSDVGIWCKFNQLSHSYVFIFKRTARKILLAATKR